MHVFKMADQFSLCSLLMLISCGIMVLHQVSSCPTKCRCTGQSTYCMYKDITTLELQRIASSIPRNTTKLYLNGNKITRFPTEELKELKYLQYLSLSVNQLEKLPEHFIDYFPRLEILYLAYNRIKTLSSTEMVSLSRIQTLSLDNNLIETIPDFAFSRMGKLKELLLAHNRLNAITENTLSGLEKLTKLQINDNGLETLDRYAFKNTLNLEEISLDSNNIRVLPNGIFSGLQNLRTLHLYNNKIEEIGENVFDGLRLNEVFLNSNHLKTLPFLLFNRTIIDGRIYLYKNKLVCDCKLAMGVSLYFKELIDTGKLSLGTCYLQKKEVQVSEITPSEQNCTICDVSPCQAGETCIVKNTTSKNYICKPPVAQIIEATVRTELSSSEKTPNYVIYIVLSIGIICVIGVVVALYFAISNRRKRKAFEVSTMDDSYIYEKANPEKDPKLTGLTATPSFKTVDMKPAFV